VIIDAHQHVWDLRRAAYPWLGPHLSPIDRTFSFEDARPELRAAGVGATVLVQAADNDEDTEHMLEVARANPTVAGVVAWVPLDDPDGAARRLAALRGSPLVVGIRNLIHDRDDPSWIVTAGAPGLRVLDQAGVPFDYVTSSPAALAHLPAISERHPSLRIVIDHLGKPPIGGTPEARRQWRRLIADAAANPLVYAKVSGLYAATGALDGWTVDQVRPFVHDALEVFGSDRLMYGGDWPVSLLAGGYRRIWDAITEILAPLAEAERAAILGRTAAACYRLDLGPRAEGASA
jgi:L-fuconolactonase